MPDPMDDAVGKKRLVRQDEPGSAWYPVSIERLSSFLEKVICTGRGYSTTYALRKNIAYNLQYLEFQDRCLDDLKLSSVLITQTWKTFIVVGCGIIESLLHFLLIAHDLHATSEWKLEAVLPGNAKQLDGKQVKVDSHFYSRLEDPVLVEMTFDAMLKKAEAKKVLGSDHSIYAALKRLRPLRNRVHLQAIGNSTDHDWNAFKSVDMKIMAEVIHKVFTSAIFRPSAKERAYFDYLYRHFAGSIPEKV